WVLATVSAQLVVPVVLPLSVPLVLPLELLLSVSLLPPPQPTITAAPIAPPIMPSAVRRLSASFREFPKEPALLMTFAPMNCVFAAFSRDAAGAGGFSARNRASPSGFTKALQKGRVGERCTPPLRPRRRYDSKGASEP